MPIAELGICPPTYNCEVDVPIPPILRLLTPVIAPAVVTFNPPFEVRANVPVLLPIAVLPVLAVFRFNDPAPLPPWRDRPPVVPLPEITALAPLNVRAVEFRVFPLYVPPVIAPVVDIVAVFNVRGEVVEVILRAPVP